MEKLALNYFTYARMVWRRVREKKKKLTIALKRNSKIIFCYVEQGVSAYADAEKVNAMI